MGEELSVYFDDEVPTPRDLVEEQGLERDKAREFVAALTRERELDLEAGSVSGDEHLARIINNPLLKAIKQIEEDNERLTEIMNSPQKMFGNNGESTPEEARQHFKDNIKMLSDLKSTLAKTTSDKGGGGVTIDIGNIFNNALEAARNASKEIPVDAQ